MEGSHLCRDQSSSLLLRPPTICTQNPAPILVAQRLLTTNEFLSSIKNEIRKNRGDSNDANNIENNNIIGDNNDSDHSTTDFSNLSVEFFLRHGADVNGEEPSPNVRPAVLADWSPTNDALKVALCSGNVKALEALIACGADIDRKYFMSKRSLLHLVVSGSVMYTDDHQSNPHGHHGEGNDESTDENNILSPPTDRRGVEKEGICAKRAGSSLSTRERMLRVLMDRNLSVNVRDSKGYTPLHTAAEGIPPPPARAVGTATDTITASIIRMLVLDFGADVEARTFVGCTPLIAAAQRGRCDAIEALLSLGADINREGSSGRSPLLWAVINGHLNAAKLLAQKGANAICRYLIGERKFKGDGDWGNQSGIDSNDGADSSSESLRKKKEEDEVKEHTTELKDTDITEKNEFQARGTTLLHCAADHGHANIVRWLLAHDVALSFIRKDDNREPAFDPMSFPSSSRDTRREQLFLINQHSREDGSTPLHLAAGSGHLEVALELIKHGADINACDDDNLMPIHRAVEHGYVDFMRVLLEFGAHVGAPDVVGMTPIHFAARCGNEKVVQLLYDHGADIHAVDLDGLTSLDYAEEHHSLLARNLLIELGAEIDGGRKSQRPLRTHSSRSRKVFLMAFLFDD